jgi:hypothetical protein
MRMYASKIVKTKITNYLLKSLIPSISMGVFIIILKYFNVPIVVNIFMAIIMYALLVFSLKFITYEETRTFIKSKES